MIKITILPDDQYLVDSKQKPKEGMQYSLESMTEGTSAQRRTREKLIMLYWKSGKHPKYGGDQYDTFRDKLKRSIGEGFNKYVYGDIFQDKKTGVYLSKIKQVKKYEEIPLYIREDPELRDSILGKLKSFSKYTKKQNQKFIDNIILDMSAAGVNDAEYFEMLEGMNDGS